MRAITIMQPWATLIALRSKRYETRSWKTNYRGPLAIHSSLEFTRAQRELCRVQPFASALLGNDDLPLGCIVAVGNLAAVFPTTREDDSLFQTVEEWPAKELAFGDFSPGRYAWLINNVRALESPIPARGAQSLWEWDETALGLLTTETNTMKKPTQFRQGDIFLIKTDEADVSKFKPAKAEKGRLILAHGEVTGHHHSVSSKSGTLYVDENNQATLLEVTEALAMLQHQEHGTIALPKGKYIVRRQREYSPEAIRNVAD